MWRKGAMKIARKCQNAKKNIFLRDQNLVLDNINIGFDRLPA